MKKVQIKPVTSTFTGKTLMFPDTRVGIIIGKTKGGGWDHGMTEDEVKNLKTVKITDEFCANYVVFLTADGLDLDLDNEEDKFKYAILKKSPRVCCDGKPTSEHMFYAYEEDKVQETNAVSHKSKLKALNILEELSPEEMRNMCFLFGRNMKDSSNTGVYNELVKIVDKDHQRFVKLYSDKYKDLRVSVNKLVLYGYVIKRRSSFMYGELMLGNSEDEVVMFLTEGRNKDLLSTLKSLILEREGGAKPITLT